MFDFFKETFEDKTKNARAVLEISKELMANLGVKLVQDKENINKYNYFINDGWVSTANRSEYIYRIPPRKIELFLDKAIVVHHVKEWLDHNYKLFVHREYHEDGCRKDGTGPKAIASLHLNNWLKYIISLYPADGLLYKSTILEGKYIPVNDLRVLIIIAATHTVYQLYTEGIFDGCTTEDSIYFYREYLSFWTTLVNSKAWTEVIDSGDYDFKKSVAYKNNDEARDCYDLYKIKLKRLIDKRLL